MKLAGSQLLGTSLAILGSTILLLRVLRGVEGGGGGWEGALVIFCAHDFYSQSMHLHIFFSLQHFATFFGLDGVEKLAFPL